MGYTESYAITDAKVDERVCSSGVSSVRNSLIACVFLCFWSSSRVLEHYVHEAGFGNFLLERGRARLFDRLISFHTWVFALPQPDKLLSLGHYQSEWAEYESAKWVIELAKFKLFKHVVLGHIPPSFEAFDFLVLFVNTVDGIIVAGPFEDCCIKALPLYVGRSAIWEDLVHETELAIIPSEAVAMASLPIF